MILNGKILVLFGLVATSFAAPVFEQDVAKNEQKKTQNLQIRAPGTVPYSVTCGTDTFTREQILGALAASHTTVRASNGKDYPAYFGNQRTDPTTRRQVPVIGAAAAKRAALAGYLREHPLGVGNTWTGGQPGLYRVIFDVTITGDEASYMGVIYHDNGNSFKACSQNNEAPACPAPAPVSASKIRRMWEVVRQAADLNSNKTKAKAPANCIKPTPTNATPTNATPTKATPTKATPTKATPTKATTANPNTTKPTTAKPTTAKPTTANPTTAKPTTAKPTTAKPTTAKPTTAKPTTAKPTTAKPTTAKPTTKKPTTKKPSRK